MTKLFFARYSVIFAPCNDTLCAGDCPIGWRFAILQVLLEERTRALSIIDVYTHSIASCFFCSNCSISRSLFAVNISFFLSAIFFHVANRLPSYDRLNIKSIIVLCYTQSGGSCCDERKKQFSLGKRIRSTHTPNYLWI